MQDHVYDLMKSWMRCRIKNNLYGFILMCEIFYVLCGGIS